MAKCLPQGAPTSPALTNVICLRLDRRLSGLAEQFGWRYSRYADDLTFSLANDKKTALKLGALIGCVTRTVDAEGFEIHKKKTRVARSANCQKVTGLVVNGDGIPRVSRKQQRQIRAAIHNLSQGKSLIENETTESLQGRAAFVLMSDEKIGRELLFDKLNIL